MLVFLVGCLGGASKKTEKPDCAAGQTFDSPSRSCQGAIVTQQVPTPTLSALSLLEDSGKTNVILTYTDINSDLAFTCTVTSLDTNLYTVLPLCNCTGGVCSINLTPDANFNGSADFFYSVQDDDGTSATQYVAVTVASINDKPTVSNFSVTVNEDTAIASVNVATAASVDDSLGGAPSENNTPLTYSVITPPSKHLTYSLTSTGTLDYTPATNEEFITSDQMVIRVSDSLGATEDITVTFNQGVIFDDNPIATTTAGTFSLALTEDTAAVFSSASSTSQLAFTEPDTAHFALPDVYNCVVNPDSVTGGDFFQTSACTCEVNTVTGAGTCTVSVLPKQNTDSSANSSAGPLVAYYVNDATEVVTSNQQTFNVPITDVNDPPVAYSALGVTFAEAAGATHVAGAQALTIADAWDEIPASVTYAIVTPPSAGTLASCMDAGSSFTKTGCTYTPTSGNLQNTGTPSAATWTLAGEIAFASLVPGTSSNSTTITIAAGFNIGNDPQIIVDPATDAITIYVDQAGTTAATDITTALAAHSIASNLISVTATPGNVSTIGLIPRVDGTGGYADSFTYTATDGSGTSQTRTVYISITATNDNPVICNYSNYNDLNACGGLGCVADSNPDDLSISPTTHTASKPIVFFNKAEGVCWKSTSVSNWELQSGSFIQDVLVNEGEGTFVINNIGIDEGGAGSEDSDTIGVTSIVSDNLILVPNGSVRPYFNNVLQTVGAMPGVAFGGATSEGEGIFRLDITPQIGVTGTANITITTEDLSGASASYQFAFTVNGFSAIHNGWKNITAEGPKFNKFDQFIEDSAVTGDENFVCSFNVDKCNSGGICKGTSTPDGVVTADAANVLYYDSANNQCYKAAAAGTTWTALNTYCAVTPSYLITDCNALGASCIGTADPNGTYTATERNQFFFDETNSTCYRSTAATNSDWVVYNAAGEITIEWESFDPIPASESISEYQVFRRLESDQFNYNAPINRETISSATTSFTDNAINSTYPPIPNTVYYYEVRPIIQGISTNTDEVFKLLRVLSPPDNTVFVHRWMVNNSMCKLMNSTSIDPNNNYRCSYEGPGDSGGVPGGNFYDIGQDLIVDRFEAGCDYSGAPTCSGTADGSCIGINDPITDTSILATAVGDIYYSRSNGKCYSATGTGAGNWAEVSGATAIAGYIKGHLPPLVNISQANSDTFCSNQTWSQTGSIGFAAPAAISKSLPSRKEQMAYSLWDTDNNTDANLTTIETGLSLNSSAKCNSSQANGFAATYSDVAVPDSNTFYSLPGTATSNIRSMMTGSNQTNTCKSRFGVQDHVGNVAEWTNERFNCLSTCPYSRTGCDTTDNQCTGGGDPSGTFTAAIGTYYLDGATCYVNTDGLTTWSDVTLTNAGDRFGASFCEAQVTGDTSALGTTGTDMRYGDGSDQWFKKYLLDGAIGPCVDSNSDDACDGGIDSWALEDERNSAGRFVIPMGLPVVTDFNSNFSSSNILDFLFEIGPTSGITSTQLRDDIVNFDTATIAAEATGCGGMATGGSYLDGTGAGVYALELLPCTDSARSYLTIGDITIVQVGTGVTPNLEFINAAANTPTEVVSANAVTGQIQVTLRDTAGNVTSVPKDIVSAINTDGVASTFAFAIVSGNASTVQSAAGQTNFTETDKKDAMIDVGFRCIAPVTGYSE
ncbi:MAG: hypothetical protein ACJAT2_000454 [Bacteriovoracaceae bacterium]|jgi:hypothetical protein